MILRLILRRMVQNKLNVLLLILSLSLVLSLFWALNTSLSQFNKELHGHSDNILIAGSTQNDIKVLFNALHFKKNETHTFPIKLIEEIKYNNTIFPVFVSHSVKNIPVAGINSEFFEKRKIKCGTGRLYIKIGECVLGSESAKKLKLKLGDTLISDQITDFDISKSTVVKMTVCGILQEHSSAVNNTIFTSLKTTWALEGIGHSHNPNEKQSTESVLDLSQGPPKTFHFHGNEEDFPVTSALIFPDSTEDKARLLAQAKQNTFQINIINPETALNEVLSIIIGIDRFLVITLIIVSIIILCLLVLMGLQSANLRKYERDIFARLGLPASFYRKIIIGEWIVLASIAGILGFFISFIIQPVLFDLLNTIT